MMWSDVIKGDAEHPSYWSRLVGREFNTHNDDSLYAATPPLESLRAIVIHAATRTKSGKCRELMVNDVIRAYFYAPSKRLFFIELPPEDGEAKPGEVGSLNVCLYGTRDAAKQWQDTISAHLPILRIRKRGRLSRSIRAPREEPHDIGAWR